MSKVKLEVHGQVVTLDYEHALRVLRTDKSKQFKIKSKHKFINNELIVDTGTRGGKKSTKRTTSAEGEGVSEPVKSTDGAS